MHACKKIDVETAGKTRMARTPFRPIQYLGNKLRALDLIVPAARELVGEKGRVTDLFSGSSVVSQAFSNDGYQVTAVDSQEYARVIAAAMLGVGRVLGEKCPIDRVLRLASELRKRSKFQRWDQYVHQEAEAIVRSDIVKLKELYRVLPLAWRDAEDPHYHTVRNGDEKNAFDRLPLITAVSAGSYFGVSQAIEIDTLRHAVEALYISTEISNWQYNALLTAIMHSASRAVHSAGKHFAQPLSAGSSTNFSFLKMRLIQDRSISVERSFVEACNTIAESINSQNNGNSAIKGLAEEVITSSSPADLYYLDPPYTAQQYSRFYHVLETICEYKVRPLLHSGKITSGLYPADRFKSAFSSRSRAALALRAILSKSRDYDAAVLVSYSLSTKESNGNARMISFEDIIELCRNIYGRKKIETFNLNYRYRQFNSTLLSNESRNDPEILVVCWP